ncbi:MAG: 1-acyl-sn-glycerol-3-phosphate acyltransferase, partial [Candidatus Omnitrophica bacterium]|nr:1-acyl-sn-glycerol-3-phosphate acyltransferase [Candidatus Omnitrophota bacterium]
WIFKYCFLISLRLFFRLKIEGLSNLPKNSNFIIVANHASYLDPLCIMATCPRRIYCIVARYLYDIFAVGWFLRKIGTIASGGSSDRGYELLMKNKNVGLFAEGKISRNGELGEFRRGAALLAKKTGRPVVPCAVLGTFQALPWEAKWIKLFVPIKVKFGKPVYLLKEFDDQIDDLYMREGIFKIRNTIKELLNE